MSKKKIAILVALIVALAISVTCLVLLIVSKSSKVTKTSLTSQKTIENKNTNANVFVIEGDLSDDKTQLIATLSLKGEVSLCRYSISLKYDSAVFALEDYDEQLGVYAPVVFPGKDESGKLSGDNFGRVNLEWASAKNVSKEADIIQIKFRVKDKKKAKSDINVLVNAVNKLSNTEVVDAEYNSSDLTVKIK